MSNVNHPQHYGGADNPYEAIKVIEAWGPLASTFCVGSALKYICRAGKKTDPVSQDLRKAAWYLNHQAELEEAKERKEQVAIDVALDGTNIPPKKAIAKAP